MERHFRLKAMESRYKRLKDTNIGDYTASAIFSCKHKITKMPICATPCNGIKEMCEDDADELCQGQGLLIVLPMTVVFATLFISVAFLIRNFRISKHTNPLQEALEMGHPRQCNEKDILVFKSRISVYKCNLDFKNAIQLADKYFSESSLEHDDVDIHFMHSLGTNELTAFFYDCIDRSITIKIGSYLQRNFPKLLQEWVKWKFQDIFDVIQCIASLSIRYSDLPKDIVFLNLVWVQVGNFSPGSFPIVIFWILFASIVAGEIMHFITIMLYQSTNKGRKLITLFCTPLMPAFFMYENLRLKLKVSKFWSESGKSQQVQYEEIEKCETKCSQLELVSSKMQCTENVLENLTLITILVMVMSLRHTTSRAVENIDNIFVETNEYLGYMLALMSFLSMIRGQLTFLKANKNRCLGLKGIFSVTPYFVIGTLSRYVTSCYIKKPTWILTQILRIFSFLLLLTPSLGIFDCLHHGRLAALPVQNGHRIFAYASDGWPFNFTHAWQPLKLEDTTHFPDISVSAVTGILITTIFFHIVVSSLIFKIALREEFSVGLLVQAFHSFIAPPLHFDWELLYRQNENVSIIECWKRWVMA